MINVLFFSRNCREEVWEYDFIMNSILPKEIEKSIYFLDLEQVRNSEKQFDVFVYSCRDPKKYEWGYMPTYEETLECVLKIKPKVIIQLSDEYSHENLEIHNSLSLHCNLMLRQHNHSEFRNVQFGTGIPKFENLIHMPLGYLNDTHINKNDIIPMCNRKLNWSFVGAIKDYQFYYYDFTYEKWLPTTDRGKMIDIFSSNVDNYIFKESGVSKKQLVDLYNNSIFVPCGRGNTSLNCFRNYECTICGAIPVVVERFPNEISIVFNFLEHPPWLYASSWEDAVVKCNNLLKYPEKLQEMQEKNLNWWNNLMNQIANKVKDALL
jgi:hypothetical protein